MAPVQAWVVGSLLPHEPSQHSSDVRGRDVNEVRPVARGLEGLDHAGRAEQIGLGRKVRGVVELDRRRRMDDDLARTQLLASGVGQAQAVTAEVKLEDRQLLLDQLGESLLAQLFSQTLEGGAGEHLALQAFGGGAAGAATNRKVDAANLRD